MPKATHSRNARSVRAPRYRVACTANLRFAEHQKRRVFVIMLKWVRKVAGSKSQNCGTTRPQNGRHDPWSPSLASTGCRGTLPALPRHPTRPPMFVQRLTVSAGSQVVVSVDTEPGKPFKPSDVTISVKPIAARDYPPRSQSVDDPKPKDRFGQTW